MKPGPTAPTACKATGVCPVEPKYPEASSVAVHNVRMKKREGEGFLPLSPPTMMTRRPEYTLSLECVQTHSLETSTLNGEWQEGD